MIHGWSHNPAEYLYSIPGDYEKVLVCRGERWEMMGRKRRCGEAREDRKRKTYSNLAQFNSNLNMHPNHLEGLLKHRVLDPTSEFLIQ